MKKIYLTAVVSVMLLPAGCRQPVKAKASPLLTDYIVDSLYLPFGEWDFPHHGISVITAAGGSEQIAYLTYNSFIYYTYDLQKKKITDTLSLIKYRHTLLDHYSNAPDSVFLLTEQNKMVLLAGGREKTWNLEHIFHDIWENVAFNRATELQMYKDTFVADIAPTISHGSHNGTYKNMHEVVFVLDGDSAVFIEAYNSRERFLPVEGYILRTDRAFLNGHQALYSALHTNTLFLYDFSTHQTTEMALKTEHFTRNSFYDEKKHNNDAFFRHTIENSQMASGIHDPSKKVVYEFMKHRGKYIEEDGTKNKYYDLPFSMFVVNEALTEQKEILIPAGLIQRMYMGFCTPHYLYLMAHPSKQDNDEQTKYYIIRTDF